MHRKIYSVQWEFIYRLVGLKDDHYMFYLFILSIDEPFFAYDFCVNIYFEL